MATASFNYLLSTKVSTTFTNDYNSVSIKLYVLNQIVDLGLQTLAKGLSYLDI